MIAFLSIVGNDNWLMDSTATHHLTPNLNSVITPFLFLGFVKVIVTNGTSLTIYHVGSSFLSGSRPLILKNVLHVPYIATISS